MSTEKSITKTFLFKTDCKMSAIAKTLSRLLSMQDKSEQESFGKRLERLRKVKGLTQIQLGQKVGLSQRMISHYESHIKDIPTSKLPKLAKALGISIDELLGLKEVHTPVDPTYAALWRRLKQAEKLSKKDQKVLLRFLDALVQSAPQSQPFKIPSLHEAAQRRMKIG